MSGFHGAFATGVACQQGTLTLPDTWFRPPFWDLLMHQLLRPNSSNLPCLYSTFHLEYPLVLSRFCLWFFNSPSIWMGWRPGTPAARLYPKSWQGIPSVGKIWDLKPFDRLRVYWLVGYFEDLHPISDISAISRLGSRRKPISEIVAARPEIEPRISWSLSQELNYYTFDAPERRMEL